ncbi:hypothetical protein SEVIR_3G229000v4 [Setaria viridis]|uniref:Uncharacterized protein n=1 Tax=Setaria viridis TaxID=4556 RepID=A0A4U6VE74_SETVI|nr:uncharacterized protein LOC117848603 isoform X1 [Setaria viridis]TKW27012.1 hypothetical protein SEVIR_3G229000v2 [Setaria viridis]
MAAADATTAMTIDFLRARLLSERSVSRAAKERADHLARRVAELEEQLRTVTAQRRKAERAAAEVLAILDSQGFGRLSDAAGDSGSGSEDEVDAGDPDAAERDRGGGNEAEDALSGSELGAQAAAAAARAGGLSWKGRAGSHDCERRQPLQQQKGRQLRQRHGHSHRRGYFYSRAADSSPKYHPGQSCRKIMRKELRSQTEGQEGKNIAAEGVKDGQERSDCTVCTDEQPDFDGEARHDGRGSSGNRGLNDDGDRFAMVYEKDGEMERVLEKQAELIGQYEAEENAQREWEKKFSESRDSTTDNVNLNNKLNQAENASGRMETAQIVDKEMVCEHARSSEDYHNPSEFLPKGSVLELPPNVAKDSVIEQRKADGSDHDFVVGTAIVASSHGELQVRKNVLTTKSYLEGSGNNLGKSVLPPQASCDSILNARYDKGQGDENSDSGSSYRVNARSFERYVNTSSVGSPLSDTPKSEVSEWSSSCFHNHTENQLDTRLHQPSSDDVGGVLEALQRARMSLRAKLSQPSPASQNILALPAPNHLPANGMQLSLSRSNPLGQEVLALQAPAGYFNRVLPQGNVKVPAGPAGLFRLPTDSIPRNEMASSDGYGSRFSLTAANELHVLTSYPANHIMSAPSFSQYGSELSPDPYHDPHSSMLLSMPTSGGYNITAPDFRMGSGSFLPEVSRFSNDFRRVMPSGNAGMHFQYGHG